MKTTMLLGYYIYEFDAKAKIVSLLLLGYSVIVRLAEDVWIVRGV